MKFIPILFSTPMAKAIQSGQKRVTRRVVKSRSYISDFVDGVPYEHTEDGDQPIKCPYGGPGDILWVRETWQFPDDCVYIYKADYEDDDTVVDRWRPSIFMPKLACRTFLQVTSVKSEPLHNITPAQILLEGVGNVGDSDELLRSKWRELWVSINGAQSYDRNPLVWVVEFALVDLTDAELGTFLASDIKSFFTSPQNDAR